MANTVHIIKRPIVINLADDYKIFDAFSPRVRAAFNYAPVKLAATPKILLLQDDEIISLIDSASNDLIRDNPILGGVTPLLIADDGHLASSLC